MVVVVVVLVVLVVSSLMAAAERVVVFWVSGRVVVFWVSGLGVVTPGLSAGLSSSQIDLVEGEDSGDAGISPDAPAMKQSEES